MLIHHFLENSASRFPDKVALVHEEVRATYGEINSMADGMASWLIDNGINQGDRVVILLDNSLEYVVSYYGILKAGAVAVLLSTGIKTEGLAKHLPELEPFAIITSKKFEKLFLSLRFGLLAFQRPSGSYNSKFNIQNSKLPCAALLPRRLAAKLLCHSKFITQHSKLVERCPAAKQPSRCAVSPLSLNLLPWSLRSMASQLPSILAFWLPSFLATVLFSRSN